MSRSRVDEPRSGASPILNGPGGQPMPHTTGLQPHDRHVLVTHHVARNVHAGAVLQPNFPVGAWGRGSEAQTRNALSRYAHGPCPEADASFVTVRQCSKGAQA